MTESYPAVPRRQRDVLTANRTYYVRTDGSDSNTGLADTSGGAFLTGQKAWDTVAALDLSIYTATIKYASGTYTGGINMAAMPVGGSSIIIEGDTTTPANVHLNCTATCFTVSSALPCPMIIRGFKFTFAGSSASAIYLNASGKITTGPIELAGGSTGYAGAIKTAAGGANIEVFGAIAITGGMSCFAQAGFGGVVQFAGITVTLTGTPAWGWVGVNGDAFGYVALAGVTFSGSATGMRYACGLNGGINTGGGGASFIPGNSAGSVTSPGWYV